jgi:hypothetical protein
LILGHVTGAGPTVLGRPTLRVVAEFDLERRVALVDDERYLVMGGQEAVVFQKTTVIQRSRIEKRTISIEYNPVLPDSLFAIPPGLQPTDAGARPRTLGSIPAAPAAGLEGLDLISSVSGPNGSAVMYGAGAFQVLVTIDADPDTQNPVEQRAAEVAGRPAVLVLSLYRLPQARFTVGDHSIVLSAPLLPDDLVELASRLYPASGE